MRHAWILLAAAACGAEDLSPVPLPPPQDAPALEYAILIAEAERLEDPEQAKLRAVQALEVGRQAGLTGDALADLLKQVAGEHIDAMDYTGALPLIVEEVALLEQSPSSRLDARLGALASAALAAGDDEAALGAMERKTERYRSRDVRADLLGSHLFNVGNQHSRMGHNDSARSAYTEAHALMLSSGDTAFAADIQARLEALPASDVD